MSDFMAPGKEEKKAFTPLPQDTAGKLALATKYKEEGTEYFKAGNFKKAITCYGKVMAFTRGLPGSKRGQSEMSSMNGKVSKDKISEEDDEKAMTLETVAYTNIATCYLKLDNPRKAMEFCSKASVSNSSAWKPYLRKSEAHAMMGNFDASKGSMSEALKLATDSESKKIVLKEKEKLNLLEKSTIASDRLKEKKMFSKIFNDEKKDVKIEKIEDSFLDNPLSALQGMASLKPLNLSMESDRKC